MTNLTITVDAETLKRARIRAIERGESVNQVLAQRLREYAANTDANADATDPAVLERQRKTLDALTKHAAELGLRSSGGPFRREEIYEERLARYDR